METEAPELPEIEELPDEDTENDPPEIGEPEELPGEPEELPGGEPDE